MKGYTYKIIFANDITVDKVKKGERRLHHTFEQWKNSGSSEILNDIRGNVTLVQMIDMFWNVSHYVSISGTCIFD